ncbi:MAG: bacillithiol biosynthesis deacetylase BshB1 [Candidatus Kapaibacteriota bacterium]
MSILQSDIIVFSAHPDDAELGCGGVIKDCTLRGLKVTLIDATRGELGSRGSIEQRNTEAAKADIVLDVHQRINLEFEDGNLRPSKEYADRVATYIRLIQPKLILLPPKFERHPDHQGMHSIVREAYFTAGLHKKSLHYDGKETMPWRPKSLYSYIQAYHQEPDFIIDISHTFDSKIAAIQCYESQVYVPGKETEGPETLISTSHFMDAVHARARYFGSMIGVEYGEGFLTIDALGLPSLQQLL